MEATVIMTLSNVNAQHSTRRCSPSVRAKYVHDVLHCDHCRHVRNKSPTRSPQLPYLQRQVGGSSTTMRAAANEMNHQTPPNAARQEG